MPPSPSSRWKKEFDEKFTYASFTWNGDNKTGVDCAKKVKRDLKAFISTLLLNQRRELRKIVEKIPVEVPHDVATWVGDDAFDAGMDLTVDAILEAFDQLD